MASVTHILRSLSVLVLCLSPYCCAMMTRARWNSLYASDAWAFESDEAFEQAHRDLHADLSVSGARNAGEAGKKNFRDKSGLYIVELEGCDTACHKALAQALGRRKYSARNAEVARITATPADLRGLMNGPLGRHIADYFPLHARLKYASTLLTKLEEVCSSRDATFSFMLSVVPLSDRDLWSVVNELLALPVELRDESLHPDVANIITATTGCGDAASVLGSISAMSEIDWIEKEPTYVLMNRWGKSLVQSGETSEFPIFAANLTGYGQIVGVSDTGLDMQSCYFHDDKRPTPYRYVDLKHRKVVYYYNNSDSTDDFGTGHGTHVSGAVAGKATIDYGTFHDFDGNAPNAKLSFFDIGRKRPSDGKDVLQPPGNLDGELFQILYTSGARIMTNSWGESEVTNEYNNGARQIDQFMYNFPDSLVLFAAGNEGTEVGLHSVTAPSTNKNGVCVGASHNTADAWHSYLAFTYDSVYTADGIADFSSIGPTKDLRMKPDLVAPGAPVYSADSEKTAQCAAKPLQGTSMACPTAAGAAALVRQYFMEGYYPLGEQNVSAGFNPSGALLKAMLIHSGTMISKIVYGVGDTEPLVDYPSIYQGYGRVTLKNVLNFAESEGNSVSLLVRGAAFADSEYYVQLENSGDSDLYFFSTDPDEDHPLRITLAYTDVPHETPLPGSSGALVHVLSLSVTNRDTGETLYSADAPGTSGNNVAMIDIASPGLNVSYMVNVTAVWIGDNQAYALVVTGKVTPFLDTSNSTTTSVNIDHDTVGITRNTLAAMFVLGAACVALMLILIMVRRENARYVRLYKRASRANTKYPNDADEERRAP